MRRPPTVVTRLLRALTAVLTVWCLGCSGFDPLVSALVGTGAGGMTCGGESSMPRPGPSAAAAGATHGDATHGGATHATIGAPHTAHGDGGYDCGCQSCHASEALLAAMPSPAPAVTPPAPAVPRLHVGLEREPLVPPPQPAT